MAQEKKRLERWISRYYLYNNSDGGKRSLSFFILFCIFQNFYGEHITLKQASLFLFIKPQQWELRSAEVHSKGEQKRLQSTRTVVKSQDHTNLNKKW